MSENHQTESLYEAPLHTTHSVAHSISDENKEYLQETDTDVDHVVTLDRLRRENGETYTQLVSCMDDEIDRKILASLTQHHGRITYEQLEAALPCSTRSIKEHVYKLCENGHLQRAGRPILVEYADETTALLAEDALNVFYDI